MTTESRRQPPPYPPPHAGEGKHDNPPQAREGDAARPLPRRRGRVGVGAAARYVLYVIVIAAAFFGPANSARAVRPDEMLPDPALEARARDIGKELRCLVCRNQSIDDSDADLAHDLRVVIRDRLKAGDSDDQVVAYVRARYGDYVLLRPPFQEDTWLLWGGPLLILALGGFGAWQYLRRRRAAPAVPPLDAEERQRLAQLLDEGAQT